MVRMLLNVAEGEPWTDGGWTKIGSNKTKEMSDADIASVERSIGNNGHMDNIKGNHDVIMNTMKMEHCECTSDNEHGYVCDREWRKNNQRLSWVIGHID